MTNAEEICCATTCCANGCCSDNCAENCKASCCSDGCCSDNCSDECCQLACDCFACVEALDQYSDTSITKSIDIGIPRGEHLAMPRMRLSVFDLIQRGEL